MGGMYFRQSSSNNLYVFPFELNPCTDCSDIPWSRGQLIVTPQVFSQSTGETNQTTAGPILLCG